MCGLLKKILKTYRRLSIVEASLHCTSRVQCCGMCSFSFFPRAVVLSTFGPFFLVLFKIFVLVFFIMLLSTYMLFFMSLLSVSFLCDAFAKHRNEANLRDNVFTPSTGSMDRCLLAGL